MISNYVGYIESMKRKFGVPQDLAVQLRVHYENLSKQFIMSDRDRKYDFYELLNGFPQTIQHEVSQSLKFRTLRSIKQLHLKPNSIGTNACEP